MCSSKKSHVYKLNLLLVFSSKNSFLLATLAILYLQQVLLLLKTLQNE